MSPTIRRTAVCAMFALAAAPALAASPDAQFARVAAQGGLAEVQSARLALQKSHNAAVQAFAQRMVADHTPNNAKLASIMRSEGLAVPATVDPNSRSTMMRLQGLTGRAFNRAYLAAQVHAHQQMQILLQSEINGGKDPKLVAYAKATLPTVTDHLAMAKTDVQRMRSRGRMSGGSMSGGSMSGGSTSGGSMSGASSPMPMSTGGAMPMSSGAPMPMSSGAPMPASSRAPRPA